MRVPGPEEIKELRKRLGITQKELAELAGVSQSLISQIEKGKVDPRVSTIRKIINALEKVSKPRITASDIMTFPAICIEARKSVKVAMELMLGSGFSQLPVIDFGRVIGSISEETVLKLLSEDKGGLEKKVEEVMDPPFPIVGHNADLDLVLELLRKNHAVLVSTRNDFGIITRADVIRFFSRIE